MKLLILSAHNTQHFGKTIKFDGSTKQSSYPTHWSPHEREIENINDFSQLALQLESECPNTSIILGELSSHGRELMNGGEVIYKRHNHDGDHKPTIQDQPQNLILLDVEYEDGLDHLSPEERIEGHVLRLPSCFHDVSYHAQLSSSFIVKRGLRVHLFFWTDQAITSALLRTYLSKLQDDKDRALVDHQPVHPSNAIIMTRPLVEGGFKDPCPNRSILVTKPQSSVSLPSSAYKAEPVREYIPQVTYSNGIIEEDKWSREALEMICMRASNLQDGRNDQLFKDAVRLGSLIGGERLYEHEVKGRLMQAYEQNGLVSKRKRRDVERTINRGIDKGKLNPNRLERYVPSQRISRAIQPRASQQLKPIQSPSGPDEIAAKTSQLIAESIRKARPRVISVAQSEAGAGKTGELIRLAKRLYDEGESVIYLALNHSLIEQKNGLIDRFQNLGAYPKHWEGRTRRCVELNRVKAEVKENLKDQSKLDLLNQYEDLLVEQTIPNFCSEIACSLRRTDQCSAWRKQDRSIEGQLIVAPHSYLSYLVEQEEKGELPGNLVIIIDESHQLIHSTPYDLDLVKGLAYREQDAEYLREGFGKDVVSYQAANFRVQHECISRFAMELHQTLSKLSASTKVNQYGSMERLTPSMLLGINPSLKHDALIVLKYIEEANPEVKRLTQSEIREAKDIEVPTNAKVKRSGLRILTDLAELMTGKLDQLHTLHLKVTSFGVHVERRVVQPLPSSARLLLADATPKLMMLSDYAEVLNFGLEVTESKINPQIVEGLHIETKQLRQSALFEPNQSQLKTTGLKSLNHLSHPIRNMLRKLNDGDQVGVLCSLKLWKQIEEAKKGHGDLINGELINTLKRFDLITGYFGRDHQGSNAFEQCKALIMLGEYKPNLGSARADFESLTGLLDHDEDYNPSEHFDSLYREQIDAITAQAFGRLRSVWRPDLIFIYASERTSQLKGVNWSLYKVDSRPIDQATQEVELQVHRLLDEGQGITINMLKDMGIKKNSATRLIKRIAKMRPVKEEKRSTGGRPSKVWFDPTIKQSQFKPELKPNVEGEKSNENSEIGLNPVSPKWSFRKLIKRGCDAVQSFTPQVPSSYIYIIGDTGLSPIYMKSKDFLGLKSGQNRGLENHHDKIPLFSFPKEAYT